MRTLAFATARAAGLCSLRGLARAPRPAALKSSGSLSRAGPGMPAALHCIECASLPNGAQPRRLSRNVSVKAQGEVHSAAQGVRRFNGPVAASARDSTAYGAERPGMNNEWDHQGAIPDSAVTEWVAHMKGEGMDRVISLLSPKELTFYETPLEEVYHHKFKSFKLINMKRPGAHQKAISFLEEAAAAGEKVVIHCAGGQGRTGLILASWLVHKYGMSHEDATAEMLAYATENNASRSGTIQQLSAFIKAGYIA